MTRFTADIISSLVSAALVLALGVVIYQIVGILL
jgi:hypothetical protein